MSKQAKIAAAVGAILFVCLVVWAVRTVPEPPPKDTGTQEQPHVMSYDNNTISEERDGVKIWELTADHIDVDIQTQNATMTNLKGTFYEEDGRTVAVEAPQAAYDAGTKDIAITGGVKIATSDGAAVDCGELKWTSEAPSSQKMMYSLRANASKVRTDSTKSKLSARRTLKKV